MIEGLLDTSIVIALAHGDDPVLPERAAISAVTLCELYPGILSATAERRPHRLATLAMAERRFRPIPLDAHVAAHFGRIVDCARRAGRRPKMGDALIAATASAHGLPVYTRDRDFLGLDGVEVVLS